MVHINKQSREGTTDLLELDENELRKLLEEAVEYRSPKDRAGKSEHFQELLTSVEAEEQKNLLFFASGAGSSSSSSRYRSSNNYNSNSYGGYNYSSSSAGTSNGRRSHGSRRDSTASVAEHLTHGGSLQNLAQESSLSCGGLVAHYSYSSSASSSSSSYYNSKSRRQTRKGHPGPSVSARQREGGSLPSNVDASHTLVGPSLANFQLAFERKKGLSEEKSVHNWFNNKEKSKSLDKPCYSKKEDKDKDKKESKLSGSCDIESESRDKRGSSKGKIGTNEMLESDNSPPECHHKDKQVIHFRKDDIEDFSEENATALFGGVPQPVQRPPRPRSLDADDDEGTEMKVIDNSRSTQFVSHASLNVSQAATAPSQHQVDSSINFPTLEKSSTQENSKVELPFPPYNSKLMPIGAGSTLSYLSWTSLFGPSNAVKCKDPPTEKIDVNGNSVQGNNGVNERKKPRRKNTQEANCITYPAQKVPGHRDDLNIDRLVNFIENKTDDNKGKKGGKTGSGGGSGGGGSASNKASAKSSKSSRDNKDGSAGNKRDQVSNKLQKSNSLEEISKTKLEDLTAESGPATSGSSNVSSNNADPINVVLRRSKQRSTGDAQAVDLRGDRRSWGTEASQSINYNEFSDYGNLSTAVKHEIEPEFFVVTNKKTKKTKKQPQGRSSSGSRAQHLKGSDLQGGREFSRNYRMPLSPDLTRKSASSVAASEKSDSSDGESNHSNRSLPATSKLGSFKTTPSGRVASDTSETVASLATSNAMQVSYAGAVTRNKPDALDKSMLSQLNYVPSSNMSRWPNVSSKSSAGAVSSSTEQTNDKLQSDHYPPLHETQKSARQLHHSSASQQHTPLSHSIDKPSSPTTIPKPAKTLPESSGKKSTEAAHEEAATSKVDKHIHVTESMQPQQSQMQQQHSQESKQQSSGNNSSPITSEAAPPLHTLPSKSAESLPAYSSSSLEVESTSGNIESSVSTSKDSSKNTTVRIRKQIHPAQMSSGAGVREFSSSVQSQQLHVTDDSKKTLTSQQEESAKSTISSSSVAQQEDKDTKKMSSVHSAMTAGPSEADVAKPRIGSSVKMISQPRPIVENETIRVNKTTDRLPKAIKDPQPISSKENPTVFYQSQSAAYHQEKQVEDFESKKSKQTPPSVKFEKEQELPRVQMAKTSPTSTVSSGGASSSSRPAVILLDENVDDQDKNVEADTSEITFGFDVNEDLLQPEESDEHERSLTPTTSPEAQFMESPPSFRPPMQGPPQQQQPQSQPQPQPQPQPPPPLRVGYPVNAYVPVHSIPPHSAVMVQTMYMSLPVSFQGTFPPMPAHIHPVPLAVVENSCRPRENFNMPRYIAPDESNLRHNVEKIASYIQSRFDEVVNDPATVYYDPSMD